AVGTAFDGPNTLRQEGIADANPPGFDRSLNPKLKVQIDPTRITPQMQLRRMSLRMLFVISPSPG
ncbi:MAG TPA: hypothetical protein VEX13_09900, partial [Chloroflexia bacterium]|nr:hypothetical protein [Chloroflexia bacterium]